MPEIISNSHDETAVLGIKIASLLGAGSVAALNGTLGSGKTCICKGIAQGLGITENLTSPTYTIINEYPVYSQAAGRLVFYHIDAYRLNSSREFEDIGGMEILNSGNICVIEWSERIINCLPPDAITITLQITGEQSRLINIDGLKGELNFDK